MQASATTSSTDYSDQPSAALEWLSRAGYAAKGVVYATVGVLTLSALYGLFGGGSGGLTGTRGAVRAIAEQPFGNILLVLLIIGLAGYVVWRFTQGIKDTEGKGTDTSGWMQRIGFMISGVVYASLTLYAINLAGWFQSGSGSSGSSKQELTARLMSYDAGIWAVGVAGAVFIGLGLYQFYRAYSEKFKESWKTNEMSADRLRFAERFAKFGISARAITLLLVGGLLVRAALQADPSDAQGLGYALQSLRDESYGMFLLTAIGLGLLCYGLYCFVNARYRTVNI